MQLRQLGALCPSCGALMTLAEERGLSVVDPDHEVSYPLGPPQCPNGHPWWPAEESATG